MSVKRGTQRKKFLKKLEETVRGGEAIRRTAKYGGLSIIFGGMGYGLHAGSPLAVVASIVLGSGFRMKLTGDAKKLSYRVLEKCINSPHLAMEVSDYFKKHGIHDYDNFRFIKLLKYIGQNELTETQRDSLRKLIKSEKLTDAELNTVTRMIDLDS